MNKISAVIIDDEFFNRRLVNMLIAKISSGFSIEGESENIRDGFKMINQLKPNVVFLDIKMPDGSGFDLLKQFGSIDFEVVFITGFDQYVLQAFDFNALDYVLKPIDVDKFKLTLEKVEARIKNKQNNSARLKQIANAYNSDEAIITKIPVQHNNRVVLLDSDEIMYIQQQQGHTVFTKNLGEKYISLKHLSEFEFILNSFSHFIRINKNTYANLNYILNYSKGTGAFINMHDNTRLSIPDAEKDAILEILSRKRIAQFKN